MSEATLDQVIELCQSCESECSRRSARFITEAGAIPVMSRSVTEGHCQRRRDDAYAKCMDACRSVAAQCPAPAMVRQLVAEQARDFAVSAAQRDAGGAGNPVLFHEPQFQLRRCEAVVSTFVSTLFWMANTPARFDLEMRDYTEQRKREFNVAHGKNKPANIDMAGGDGGAFGDPAGGGGADPQQLGMPRPGTAHLSEEQRARLETIAAQSDPKSVRKW